MPSKRKVRDAAYYRRRLERDFPAIYADLLAKRYSSTRQAAAAAGLIHLPTRLDALKRDWKRATPKEQREFIEWLKKEHSARTRSTTIAATVPVSLVGADGLLLPDVVNRINAIRGVLGQSTGDTKADMGLSRFDFSWNQVLERKRRPNLNMIGAIDLWLRRYSLSISSS